MRKLILSFLVASLCLTPIVNPARADGAIFPGEQYTGYLIVRYHHVNTVIEDNHAVTHVEQEFYNPYEFPIVGRYLFPIQPEAALTTFTATVDGETQQPARQDAAATNAALQSLIVQYRDPTLLQYTDWETLAFDLNLPAKSSRRMVLEYEEVLTPAGGMLHYRYILGTERYSAQALEEVSLTVIVRSTSGLSTVYSSSHPITVENLGTGAARVSWSAQNVLPSQDFDLFFAPAEGGFGSGLLTSERAGYNHFLFIFSPSLEHASGGEIPKDIVFVVDDSGSMEGEKIAQAQNALKYCLGRLGADDRFSIVGFDDQLSVYADTLQPTALATILDALRFSERLSADGSTDIEAALRKGLAILLRSEDRPAAAQMIVFLTDGLPTAGITDETLIAESIRHTNSDRVVRMHIFGVGYDVNTHLLDRLAEENGGSVTYVQPGENLETVLTSFYKRIAFPVLTDIYIEYEGMTASDISPQSLPDLFQGTSMLLVGRFEEQSKTITLRVRGRAGEEQREYEYRFDLAQTAGHDFVPRLWATRRVGALLDEVRVTGETPALVEEIRSLGLTYGIVTPYTTFVIAAQTNGAASAENMSLYSQRDELNQSSGSTTIQARVQNQGYQQASQADTATGANVLNRGQQSLAQLSAPGAATLNVDLALLQEQNNLDEPVDLAWIEYNVGIDQVVEFGSKAYFELAKDSAARDFLQTGMNVVFRHNGQVVRVFDGQAAHEGGLPLLWAVIFWAVNQLLAR